MDGAVLVAKEARLVRDRQDALELRVVERELGAARDLPLVARVEGELGRVRKVDGHDESRPERSYRAARLESNGLKCAARMKTNLTPYLAAAAVLGAAGWALVRKPDAPAEPPPTVAPEEPLALRSPRRRVPCRPATRRLPRARRAASPHDPHDPAGPAMGAGMSAGDDRPAIAWTVPSGWQTAPNPSPMRIATYHPSPAVDVSVSRAGGASEANIDRWVHQFEGASTPKRTDTSIAGIPVLEVEVGGSYTGGGMMGGPAPEPHPGYSLVGAIVETAGAPLLLQVDRTVRRGREGASLVRRHGPRHRAAAVIER